MPLRSACIAPSLVYLGLMLATGLVPQAVRAQTRASSSIDLSFRDTTCAPCRDFNQYANGDWIRRTIIPPDRGEWSTWIEMLERNRGILHAILDSLSAAALPTGSAEWKVGRFYQACMDSARAERDGARPLQSELARIDAITSMSELRAEIAALQRMGVGVAFRLVAAQDPRHSTQVIAHLRQGGLGLPDRDYYVRTDSVAVMTRREYVAHIARTLALTGVPSTRADREAMSIMALETRLAKASMTIVEREDPAAIYHIMTIAQLDTLSPAWSWPAYLRDIGAPAVRAADVEEPRFFTVMTTMVRTVPLADWKSDLRWRYAATAAPFLSSAFVQEDFRFASVLTGAPNLQVRWKRCLAETDGQLGEALGRAYVARVLPPAAKAKALALVQNVEGVLRDDLSTLAWMSDATRHEALAKLAAFTNKIGYPDVWRDYRALALVDGPFWADMIAAGRFETARQLAKIGRPLDRGEWRPSPPTVDAYYNPPLNEVVFPAGILQPPYFDPNADDASNYGGIGWAIGHELTHGFDDQGRQFDQDGNLRDWWTATDAAEYENRASRVVRQYDQYVVLDSAHVSGRQTLSENIADIGGVKIAYAAFERAAAGKPRALIDGLTPEQRFFLAFAQSLRGTLRPAYQRTMLQVDVHSPLKWRVNGVVSNMPEFAQAFGCKAGDALTRPDSSRAQIW